MIPISNRFPDKCWSLQSKCLWTDSGWDTYVIFLAFKLSGTITFFSKATYSLIESLKVLCRSPLLKVDRIQLMAHCAEKEVSSQKITLSQSRSIFSCAKRFFSRCVFFKGADFLSYLDVLIETAHLVKMTRNVVNWNFRKNIKQIFCERMFPLRNLQNWCSNILTVLYNKREEQKFPILL